MGSDFYNCIFLRNVVHYLTYKLILREHVTICTTTINFILAIQTIRKDTAYKTHYISCRVLQRTKTNANMLHHVNNTNIRQDIFLGR